ncbi:PRC-barrel domain-containing protein [uncultured Tateyamaria sp.]|uniref:PRC-barrel domain-containing protein n=1 Tax=uncultured Tateyamaria sp. TaxID=455651 RepID=UPI0026290255|nr:PRC-barrel domain-containing protein [uncultured Tateyamaria sp.]
MTRFLTSTAAVLALSTSAVFAQSETKDNRWEMHNNTAKSAMSSEELSQAQGTLIRSRDITGGAIYTMNQANDEGWDPEMNHEEVGADWNKIGEIEDLVLTSDGKVTGIVAEVGGFLDIGDKHVVISVSDLNLVAVDDKTYAYVTKYNEEDLEEMQGVDEGFWN